MAIISIDTGNRLALVLTTCAGPVHTGLAPFNSGAGFGDLDKEGGHPPHGGFFASAIALVRPQWAGRVGIPSGMPVSCRPVRQPRPVPLTLLARGGGNLTATTGGHYHG